METNNVHYINIECIQWERMYQYLNTRNYTMSSLHIVTCLNIQITLSLL